MKKLSIIHRMYMPISELEEYYMVRRKYRFAQGVKLQHILLREKFYPMFSAVLMLDRCFRKQTITVIGNRKKHNGKAIYACTHIGENDLENIYEVLQTGCYWFVGDPCVLYKDISGLLLYLNGCVLLETSDKEDRHIAYKRAVEVLQGEGSLMIFPEGARNGTENLPVMELFQGAAKMAIETNTEIVPIAIEQYDKHFIINFGNALSPTSFGNATELTQNLRDELATLKWEIWERERVQERKSLPENYKEIFAKEFEKRIQPYDTLETVERARYHSKTPSPKEAFAYLDKLIPSKENAFLFRELPMTVFKRE
jgi:1-acyl-sn-glycerol-3-phosphate acyltransferase